MKEKNSYSRQLTEEDIQELRHRAFIGGMWEEIGRLQYDFLIAQGLQSHHKLLDIGCGALRGGLHFIKFLQRSGYFGIDINQSLIEGAKHEVNLASLGVKKPTLLVNGKFEFSNFSTKFDFIIAQSVFTHLPINDIIRCLKEVKGVLKKNSTFYATSFLTPNDNYLENYKHEIGGIVTKFDSDPFHYNHKILELISQSVGLKVIFIGDWKHPRNQQMLAFQHI